MGLDELKNKSGLSGKAWDKSIKGLRKHSVVNVAKVGEDVTVELVG